VDDLPLWDKMGYWFERLLSETGELTEFDRKIAIFPAGYESAGIYHHDQLALIIMTYGSHYSMYAHELGHDLGLAHSSAPWNGNAMHTYGDDALMGFSGWQGKYDFNAGSRYQLGWIEGAAVLDDDIGILRPLNVEATVTSPFLVLKHECDECWSKRISAPNGQNRDATKGGTLIVSFRVGREAGGDNNDFGIIQANLVNKVHVHFLSATGRGVAFLGNIQRMAVLAEYEEYEWRSAETSDGAVLGGLVVCKLVVTTKSTEDDYAKIAVGTNAADARSKCANI